jgi:hypothetical protein
MLAPPAGQPAGTSSRRTTVHILLLVTALLGALLPAAATGAQAETALVEASIVKATASDQRGSHAAENTIDDDLSTRWWADGRANGDADAGPWVVWQLADVTPLTEARLAFHEGGRGGLTSFHLETSLDGRTWQRVMTGTSSGTDGLQRFGFDETEAAYVRYVGEGREDSDWNSVRLVRLIGPSTATEAPEPPEDDADEHSPSEDPEPDPEEEPETQLVTAGAHRATASDAQDPNLAPNAIDGDLATRWSAEGRASDNGGRPWLQVELDGIYRLHEANIAWFRGDNGDPATFHIDVSTDGSTWSRAKSSLRSSGDTLEPQRFTIEPVEARYVRYVGEGRELTEWNSVTNASFRGEQLEALPPDPEPDPEDEPTPVEDSDDRHATEISHGTQLRREHTGLPADWNGTPSGQVTSSYHGQVIEHLDVDVSGTDSTAAIDVRHNNVTVRYVRVNHRNGRNGVRFAPGTTGGRVEFSEFNGHYRTEPTGNFGSIGVLVTGEADVYRNFFRGGRDGVHLRSGNSSAVENWVEDLHRHQDAHNDGLLFYGRDGATNIKFLRNRTVEGNSGGINLYAHDGHIRDVELRDNLIVGVQRGFGLRGGRTHVSRNNYQDNRDIRIEGNRFSGTFGYPNALGEGTNAGVDLSRPGNTFTNNRWVGSTTDLPARCGVHRDTCES